MKKGISESDMHISNKQMNTSRSLVVQKIPLTTMATSVLLEVTANEALHRERVYRDQEDFFGSGPWLAHLL